MFLFPYAATVGQAKWGCQPSYGKKGTVFVQKLGKFDIESSLEARHAR